MEISISPSFVAPVAAENSVNTAGGGVSRRTDRDVFEAQLVPKQSQHCALYVTTPSDVVAASKALPKILTASGAFAVVAVSATISSSSALSRTLTLPLLPHTTSMLALVIVPVAERTTAV